MEANFILRKAAAEDAGRILELFIEMLQTIHGTADPAACSTDDFAYYFAGNEDLICIAEVNGAVIGFLSMEVHREETDYIYLDDFSVDKEYRGRGIGTAMLKEAEQYARRLAIDTLVLHVEKNNAAARRLYERHGFSPYRDDGDRLCMVRNLM